MTTQEETPMDPNHNNYTDRPERDPFIPNSYQPGPGYQSGFNGDPIHTEPQKPKKPRKKKGWVKFVALGLVCALVGAAAMPVYEMVTGSDAATLYVGDRKPTEVKINSVNTEKEMTTAEIYAAYVGSSVGITVDIVSTNIFGQTVTNAAAGSGFVITEDGYILTNYHVIDGASAITVAFVDGKTYPATFIGGEEANDIAVIKIEANDLTPVVIGKSSDMLVGEKVTAIGNPLGELTFSETTGIISAMDRTITMSDGRKMNMIQTDCAINSGNSGGPLFNSHGEVIGIVSAKYSSSGSYSSASVEGLGFAIPINDVSAMIQDIMTNGYITNKPYLGITGGSMTEQMAAQYRYDITSGVFVYSVEEGKAAQKAGLQMGDVITKVDDHDIKTMEDLTAVKKQYSAGDTATLTVYREKQTITVELTWDAVPADQQTSQTEQSQNNNSQSGNNGNYYTNPFDIFNYFFR